jgi:ATP-dependent helicase/nuclease subunit A
MGEDGQAIGNAYHRLMQLADLKRLGSAEVVQVQVDQLIADRRLSAEQARLLSVDDVVWFAGTEEGRRLALRADGCRREVPFVYALPIAGSTERTVLRGVIDCLLETEDGLWILDYKTDRVADAAELERRIDGYTVQLQLYALAAAAVFAQKVIGAALIFLRGHRVVPVPAKSPALDTLLAQLGGFGEVS